MKDLILIVSCLLLMLIAPMNYFGGMSGDIQSTECCVTEGGFVDKSDVGDDILTQQGSAVLYDDDAMTLLMTYHAGNDDVAPFRMNTWGHQLRVLSTRLQFRCQSVVLLVKRLIRLLSVHFTTLVHHITQFYSSIHSLCWQHAVDCYVFAFRQIII